MKGKCNTRKREPFIAANKTKTKLKAKVKTLQEKCIVYETIKI
jgi:hypothetical protein